ncbi:hypothetical protein N657DRAFT_644387 [Parathielavia appendiculata]|uniref:Zn(2)-C6 fungal-type domain-containing protein n=1 Tax=Parathielavia appendiculata TaxID=2587402 RepID=A0AAN6U2U9_9PEZI|nr:hypothetical protein N657DRAFT_644387 [Parathielavia appendiculata]
MVYCGKPSKGCQMCRTRRIKCDETKPTCNQCAKARRQCPGYKDEFDLVLRNENFAAKRRALKLTAPRRKKADLAEPSSASTSSSSSSSSASSTSLSSSSSPPTPTASPPLSTTTASTTSSTHRPLFFTRNHQQQQDDYSQRQQIRLALSPTPIHLPVEDLAPCHFVSNFVLLPRQDGSRGWLEYLIPLMQSMQQTQQQSHQKEMMTMTTTGRGGGGGGGGDMAHLFHAFNACALASWGNRVGGASFPSSGSGTGTALGSVSSGPGVVRGGDMSRVETGIAGGAARMGGDGGILGKAFAEYSRALKATQAALTDPERWRSDGVLAAVLLLGMFENISAKQMGTLAWGSHIEGAIQLVKARGRSQLRTRLGVQLFIAVRTQLIIHTLTTGTAPAMGADWWIQDAVVEPTATECQRLSLKAGELRADVTRVLGSAARTPENIELVQSLMRRAQALDKEVTVWMCSVPEAWRYRTLCWQSHNLAVPGDSSSSSDYSKAEVFPGRVDVYNDFWVAAVWNSARTARLILMSIAVRCAAWVCSPVDYRTTPEYATAARLCVDTIADILASVPYHLGWHTKRRDFFRNEDGTAFACGEEDGMKGLAGYFLTWPLACVMTQDYSTDAQRAYVRGRLHHIGDELGIKYAHIIAQLQVRVPSMLIRSDGLLAKPYPMAHNFEKLLSSRFDSPLTQAYTLKERQLPQQWTMQQEQFQQGDEWAGGQ